MSQRVDLLCEEVIHNLKQMLIVWKGTNLSATEIELEITTSFQGVFNKAESVKEKEKLYRKLALRLHPDKLSCDPAMLVYLTQLDLKDVPHKILARLKEKKWSIVKVKPTPVHWLKKSFNQIDIYLRFADSPSFWLQRAVEHLSQMQKFGIDFFAQNFSFSAPEEAVASFSLQDNLNRYSEPWKSLAEKAYFLLTAYFNGVIFVTNLVKSSIPFLLRSSLDYFANLLTKGRFEAEKAAYIHNKLPEMTEKYLNYLKELNKTTTHKSDEEFLTEWKQLHLALDLCTEENFEEEIINKPVRRLLEITGFLRVKFILSALYDTFKQPLAEGESKFINILTWPVRVLAALLIIGLSIIVASTDYLLDAVSLAAGAVSLAVTTAFLVILNLPLLIWDALSYVATAVSSVFDSRASTQANVDSLIDRTHKQVVKNSHSLVHLLLPAVEIVAEDNKSVSSSIAIHNYPAITRAESPSILSDTVIDSSSEEEKSGNTPRSFTPSF